MESRRDPRDLALALDAAKGPVREELENAVLEPLTAAVRADKLRRLYQKLGVFERAEALVDKCRSRAEAVADEVQPEALRQLLYFLVDTVLAHSPATPSPASLVPLSGLLPIIGNSPVGAM